MKKYLLLSVAVIAVLMGCGSKEGGAEGTAGSGGAAAVVSMKDKVVGTWKIDIESVKMSMITEEVKKSPQYAQIKEGLAKVSLELKADGTYAGTSPDGKTDTGKWTIADKSITMTPDKKEDQKGQPTLTVNDDATKIHASSKEGKESVDMDFVR